MKQMTKEELIEYFIEQLGDNEILGKYITIDQIREKLNRIVRNVTYNNEVGDVKGSWDVFTGTINLDFEKMSPEEQNQIMVHELLHALSTTIREEVRTGGYLEVKTKCGLRYSKYSGDKTEGNEWVLKNRYNRYIGINEGMTDILAEMITGVHHNGYNDQKDIYKIISIAVGNDVMLHEYFAEPYTIGEAVYGGTFEDILCDKYEFYAAESEEDWVGDNSYMYSVFPLLDKLTNIQSSANIGQVSQNGWEMNYRIKSQIYEHLEKLITQIIDNEPDSVYRIQKILKPAFLTSFNKKFTDRILGDLIKSDKYDYNTKISMLEQLTKFEGAFIPEEITQSILFQNEESKCLSPEEKLNYFLTFNNPVNQIFDAMYDLYIQSGRISEDKFPKREICRKYSEYRNAKGLDEYFKVTRYMQIGEYYLLYDSRNPVRTVEMCNAQGEIVELNNTGFSVMTLNYNFFDGKNEDKALEMQKQIMDKFSNMEKQLKTEDTIHTDMFVCEKTFRLRCYSYKKDGSMESIEEWYEIDENGVLVPLELRTRKKIYG